MVDQLAGANWQRSGGRSSNKPKPYPRPGSRDRKRMGTVQRDPDEMRGLLEQRRRGLVPDVPAVVEKKTPHLLRF